MFFDKWLTNDVDDSWSGIIIFVQEKVDQLLHVTAEGFR